MTATGTTPTMIRVLFDTAIRPLLRSPTAPAVLGVAQSTNYVPASGKFHRGEPSTGAARRYVPGQNDMLGYKPLTTQPIATGGRVPVPRVLVADDSPLVLRIIEKMLAGAGYAVLT